MDRSKLVIAALACLVASPVVAAPKPADTALVAAIQSDFRSPKDKARDVYRHPEQSLKFWGLKPGDVVIDVQPGAGWWTDILSPYLARTGGKYIAASADLSDPELGEWEKKGRATFEAKYRDKPAAFGKGNVVNFGPKSAPLAPAGSVDFILVSRATHNWVEGDFIAKAFADFHAALKRGGILAIEDHRAPAGADPAKGDGYLPEAYVIAQARKAGFTLVARSEINANPKDTKNYPFGVWTLPPTRQTASRGQPANPNFDHSKYDAIGESDRMTLKFVKR